MTWHYKNQYMQQSPFPLVLSTLVDMWRMSKILAVQSLLLVMSMLLSTGLTWHDVTCTQAVYLTLHSLARSTCIQWLSPIAVPWRRDIGQSRGYSHARQETLTGKKALLPAPAGRLSQSKQGKYCAHLHALLVELPLEDLFIAPGVHKVQPAFAVAHYDEALLNTDVQAVQHDPRSAQTDRISDAQWYEAEQT